MEIKSQTESAFTRFLQGKVLKGIRYQSDEEAARYFWSHSAPVLVFTDGTEMVVMQDKCGGGPGALDISTSASRLKNESHLLGPL